MKKSILFAVILISQLSWGFAQEEDNQEVQGPPPSPEKVAEELKSAEEEFKHAKEMFDPWYAGPLLTGGAHIVPPGIINIQPYLFVTNNYGHFDNSGDSHSIPHNLQINPVFFAVFGIVKNLDIVAKVQTVHNRIKGHCGNNFGDSALILEYGILEEKPYVPAIKIAVKETFPTGKFERLKAEKSGVDATGGGAYATTLILNVAKLVWWWWPPHPMNFRLSLSYGIPAHVHVKGHNAYGGGFGTRGTVDTGNSFSGGFGYEFSFVQRWVFALDVAYSYSQKVTFSGKKGVTATGAPASVGGPFSDQLSLAPALEYNPTPDLGIVAGVWFSVWGRNASNFVSGIATVTYSF